MRYQWIVICATMMALSICLLSASGMTQNVTADKLPSISELEQLSFTPTNTNSLPNPCYMTVSSVRSLFLAYAAGSGAVSKYRDPALTRGTSGISVFKAVSPSVVVVVVGNVKHNKFDPEGLGTGAIIDTRGYVLTNWHVINNHVDAVVFLKPTNNSDLDNADTRIARVVYEDPTVDLALLKMTDPPTTLGAVLIGNINDVQIGEDIHVIGHPNGNLWSYSTGVVSQIRDDYKWSYEDGSKHEAKVLQLQTAINPGNSGGPVLDDTGHVLALVAMSEEGQNLDYAIAVDVIKRFLFTGMQMTTRGGEALRPCSKTPQQLSVAKLDGSTSVLRATYPDLVLYSVSGKKSGLVAKFNDGTEIKAWDPNSNGDFTFWSATLPNGKELMATAAKGLVTHISAKH